MGWSSVRHVPKMSSVVAVLCLAFTVFIGCSIAGQMADARRIDASPARVKGTVDRIIPGSRGSGSVVRVSYQAAGRRLTTTSLPLGLDGHPWPVVGDRLCLEVAAGHPEAVRLCGDKYPRGADWFATYQLMAVAGTAGTLMALGFVVSALRARSRPSVRRSVDTTAPSRSSPDRAGGGSLES